MKLFILILLFDTFFFSQGVKGNSRASQIRYDEIIYDSLEESFQLYNDNTPISMTNDFNEEFFEHFDTNIESGFGGISVLIQDNFDTSCYSES